MLLASRASDAATLGVAWDPPTDGVTVGYIVRYGTSPGNYSQSIDVGMVTSHSITTLADGTTYYFAVQAYNASRQFGPLSAEVTGTTPGGTTAPAAPTSLVGVAREGRYIDLSWRAPSGTVTGYRVEVGTATGQSNVTTATTGTATSYTVSGLSAATYYIRVRAINSAGTSGPSNEVVVTLGTTTASPTNLTGNVSNGTSAALSWQPPSGTVSSYRVEVGTASGQSNVRTTSVTLTTLTISDLRGGPYYVRVRAVSGSQVSAASNEVSVLFVTGAPTNLTAAIRRRKDVDLAWQAPSTGAPSYRIEVGNAPGLSNIATATSATTQFTARDLPAGTYYVRVRGANAAGLSAPSNEVRVDIVRGGKPLPPRNVSATLSDSNLIDVTWVPDDDEALYYRVEVGTTSGRTDVSSFTTGVTSRFTIGELPARRYYIRVRSANDSGFSDPSNEVVVAGVGGTDAPRRLSASVSASGAIRLFWDEPQDATGVRGYVIEAGTGPGRVDIGSIPTNARSFASGPVPNGTYFIRVRSMTAAGPGSASNEVVAHVGEPQQCTAPPAAPRLVANAIGGFLELSWSPGVGDAPTGYVLDVGTSPGRRDILSMPLGAEITTLTAQAPNGTYALRLIAVNGCGASTWGTDTSVTIGATQVELPGAPGWLEHQVNGRSVTLTWSPPITGGTPTSYLIEVLGPAGQVLLSLQTGNLSTTFTHGSAPPGQYTVRVRAMNTRGAGSATNSVVFSVP